jgi:hypothetical protein
MKKVIFFLVLSFVVMHSHFAQNNSLRLTQQYLMSHKWYPDIYSEDSKKSSIITYSSTQMIDSVFVESVNSRVNIRDYYLSDSKDAVFDTSKFGYSSSGKYIIERVRSINPQKDDLILIMEVVFISEEKMELRNLTSGFSSLGYVTTYYTSPGRFNF